MRQSKRTGWGGPREGAGQPRKQPTTVVRLRVDIADYAKRLQERVGPSSGIGAFLRGEVRTSATAPLVTATVACGFPSPAEDHLDRRLDLNELHGIGRAEVILVHVSGDSMTGAGIFDGDIVTVDKGLEPRNGSIVVACLNGEFLLKSYFKRGNKVTLNAANPAFPNIDIPEAADFFIWGVVTHSTRAF